MIIIPLGDGTAAANLKKIAACLRSGGIIAYPTDTLYGLGGSFLSPAAHARIDALKGRSAQPYAAAVGSLAMLEPLVAEVPAIVRDRLRELLPGKFTFLFKPSPAVDPLLLRNSGKIGMRIPALPPLLQLIGRLGFPIITTSVNRGGEPPLNDPRQIALEFPGLDLLIDGGVLPPSRGSTVVDLTSSPPQIVRQGDGIW